MKSTALSFLSSTIPFLEPGAETERDTGLWVLSAAEVARGTGSDVQPEPESLSVDSDAHEQTVARLKDEVAKKDEELAAKVRWVVLCAVVRLLLNYWLRLGWPMYMHRTKHWQPKMQTWSKHRQH